VHRRQPLSHPSTSPSAHTKYSCSNHHGLHDRLGRPKHGGDSAEIVSERAEEHGGCDDYGVYDGSPNWHNLKAEELRSGFVGQDRSIGLIIIT
jgi:hypothetical protein